eukprot:Amastigsp_a340659_18.p5 type:complete len:111 gc:universal Amastigsp_a340659_18:1172-840(-)
MRRRMVSSGNETVWPASPAMPPNTSFSSRCGSLVSCPAASRRAVAQILSVSKVMKSIPTYGMTPSTEGTKPLYVAAHPSLTTMLRKVPRSPVESCFDEVTESRARTSSSG